MKQAMFLFFLLYSLTALAQPVKTPVLNPENSEDLRNLYPQRVRNVIKTNPLVMLWGSVLLTSEIRLMNELVTARKQSTQVGFSYYGKSPIWLLIENDTTLSGNATIKLAIKGYRFQVQQKFYLNGKGYSPKGFYVSPHLSYSSVRLSTKFFNQYDNFIRITQFDLNLLAGIQAIKSNFAFDFFWGVGYKKNLWTQFLSPNKISNTNPPNDTAFGRFYNSPVKISLGFNIGAAF